MKYSIALAAALGLTTTVQAADLRPDQKEFRDLFKELVETNTQPSDGSCTLAAERMAARLKASGYRDDEVTLFTAPGFPLDGGLVAVLKGTDTTLKPVLLLAHLDVIEAKREDWQRDPYVLVEEKGKFYGRGTSDDKAQAAIWTDTLIRLRREGYKPRRTIKMALTCDEEGIGRLNGVSWLLKNRRDLIDAEFALNEGGYIAADDQGRAEKILIEAGQKKVYYYDIEVTNPGGHAGEPRPDNAINRLAHALTDIQNIRFPVELTDVTRAYFAGMAKIEASSGHQNVASEIAAMLKEPMDRSAADRVAASSTSWNSLLRATCIPTLINGGHAQNAQPQHVVARVNCRAVPTPSPKSAEDMQHLLVAAVNDPGVTVKIVGHGYADAPPPPLTGPVLETAKRLMHQTWPQLPTLPFVLPWGTDGAYLDAAGIPTYGINPLVMDANKNFVHGLNEYVGVESLYEARDFLFKLTKLYGSGR